MKKITIIYILYIAYVIFATIILSVDAKQTISEHVETIEMSDMPKFDLGLYTIKDVSVVEELGEPPVDIVPLLSEKDINLIALVTMAEAEGECEEGKRLVIDTVLNRVDSPYFPDTVYDVIYQPCQFSSMWNGRVDRCMVMDSICQLVIEELISRTNNDVIFFTAGGYSKYGVPMFYVENHYFSSYD